MFWVQREKVLKFKRYTLYSVKNDMNMLKKSFCIYILNKFLQVHILFILNLNNIIVFQRQDIDIKRCFSRRNASGQLGVLTVTLMFKPMWPMVPRVFEKTWFFLKKRLMCNTGSENSVYQTSVPQMICNGTYRFDGDRRNRNAAVFNR